MIHGNIKLTDPKETREFKDPIAVRFFETLEALPKEIKNTDILLLLVEPILGKEPIIPSSPDMDARLEAADEFAMYMSKADDIILKAKNYMAF